ncbi:MAG TPA: hypothetical protein VIK22_09075 [Candidatus Anoxymicrobiaceae bacterium]
MNALVLASVNWGIVIVYAFLAIAIGMCCGYFAGKIAKSASLSFTIFFMLGLLLNVIGVAAATVARATAKSSARKRAKAVPEVPYSSETPSYYQPVYLEGYVLPEAALSPSPVHHVRTSIREYDDTVGMPKCPSCDADNPRNNEFCWKCGEFLRLARTN